MPISSCPSPHAHHHMPIITCPKAFTSHLLPTGAIHVRGPAPRPDQLCAPEADARVQGQRPNAGRTPGTAHNHIVSDV
eukprot:scaffold113511_cov22-Tisochrysis_lutea.AAC.1